MERIVSTVFPTLDAAQEAAENLVRRGIPQDAISIVEQENDAAVPRSPAVGPSLGSGILPDAANALIEQHDVDAGPAESPEEVISFLVQVEVGNSGADEKVARDILQNASRVPSNPDSDEPPTY